MFPVTQWESHHDQKQWMMWLRGCVHSPCIHCTLYSLWTLPSLAPRWYKHCRKSQSSDLGTHWVPITCGEHYPVLYLKRTWMISSDLNSNPASDVDHLQLQYYFFFLILQLFTCEGWDQRTCKRHQTYVCFSAIYCSYSLSVLALGRFVSSSAMCVCCPTREPFDLWTSCLIISWCFALFSVAILGY